MSPPYNHNVSDCESNTVCKSDTSTLVCSHFTLTVLVLKFSKHHQLDAYSWMVLSAMALIWYYLLLWLPYFNVTAGPVERLGI